MQVNNLESREKLDHLKLCLTAVFKRFGPILDIIAKGSVKRKGQAFIVFDSEKSTLDAVELMDGFVMHNMPMRVARAKTHSDETVKRKAPEMFEEHKRKRLMAKGMAPMLILLFSFANSITDFKRAEEEAKAQANPAVAVEKARTAKTGPVIVPDRYLPPNKSLALKEIPDDVTEDDLTSLYERFEGFKEVRLVAHRRFAVVEFESDKFSITAKEATANIPIGSQGKLLNVAYQRQ